MTIEQPHIPPQTVATDTPAATVFTLETLLWAAVALAALGMRLVQLGAAPLSEAESALAYEAWRAATGGPADLYRAGLNPFAFNLNHLLFYLFGAGDGIARIGSMAGGTLLVLSAWLYRPLLGRGHALGTALLLALSPTVLFFSRNAAGEIWGALFAFVLVAAVARWRQAGSWSDALLAVAALGLGLTADGGFWSVLVAGGLLLLLARRRARAAGDTGAIAPFALPVTPYALLAVAAALFLLEATGFGTNLEGLGAAFNQPVQWLQRVFGGGERLVLPFFFVVLIYEFLPVVLGVIGGVRLMERKPLWALFGFTWLLVTLLPAALANSGWTGALLYVTLPLVLLGGGALARLGSALLDHGSWRIEGTTLLVTLALFLYFWINLSLYLSAPDTIKLVALAIPVVAGALALVYLYNAYSPSTAWRAGGLAALLIAAIVTLSSAWGLNINRAADPREPLVTRPSDSNLRTAAAQLAQVSTERYRDAHQIPLAIQETLGYAPRWYFRDFRDVTFVTGNTGLPEAALLDRASPPADGLGKIVFLGQSWQWTAGDAAGALRWLKTRNDGSTLTNLEAVLYVRLP